jgi:hypothetical protein
VIQHRSSHPLPASTSERTLSTNNNNKSLEQPFSSANLHRSISLPSVPVRSWRQATPSDAFTIDVFVSPLQTKQKYRCTARTLVSSLIGDLVKSYNLDITHDDLNTIPAFGLFKYDEENKNGGFWLDENRSLIENHVISQVRSYLII